MEWMMAASGIALIIAGIMVVVAVFEASREWNDEDEDF